MTETVQLQISMWYQCDTNGDAENPCVWWHKHNAGQSEESAFAEL